MLGIRHEYVILTVAWRPLANTFVQASGSMPATAELLVFILIAFLFLAFFLKKIVRNFFTSGSYTMVSESLSSSPGHRGTCRLLLAPTPVTV